MKLLSGGKIVLHDKVLERHSLLFSDRILSCIPEDRAGGIEAERFNVCGAYVSPGFIDVHVHGAGGADAMDATDESMDVFSRCLAGHGVTAFLPTALTSAREHLSVVADNVKRAMKRRLPGASVFGLHLEGPWIDCGHKGAHPQDHIENTPDAEWVAQRADVIRTVTFSPQKDPNHVFLKRLLELKIVPSLGHTDAGFEEGLAAIEAGAKSITHLFNAQTGLHHRAPGLVGAALCSSAMCELVPDGEHVRAELFEPLCKALSTERLMLVTDSTRAAGLPNAGLPRLRDGTIAGSSLSMDRGVLNVWKATGRPLPEVVRMATANPARLHGLESRRGSIAPGCDADITCFDEQLDVFMTFVGGRLVYERRRNG